MIDPDRLSRMNFLPNRREMLDSWSWTRGLYLIVLGALEAVAGMLMFGISTAYVFAVMQLYWPILQAIRQH
jgi:hypothetical protein